MAEPPTSFEPRPGAEAGRDAAVARLEDERVDLVDRLAELARDMDGLVAATHGSNVDDEHDPEGQTIAYERSQLAAVTGQAREHLLEVDAALRRVADGTYGVCEVCGRAVPAARLEARPTARTCVEHVRR